jgi:hypothetical protein
MRIWILIFMMRMRIRILVLFDADVYPDADPGYQNDADPCGSGTTTLLPSPLG